MFEKFSPFDRENVIPQLYTPTKQLIKISPIHRTLLTKSQ